MSNVTELAAGQINQADSITVDLVTPPDAPATVLIRWPDAPSVLNPARPSSCLMQRLATPETEEGATGLRTCRPKSEASTAAAGPGNPLGLVVVLRVPVVSSQQTLQRTHRASLTCLTDHCGTCGAATEGEPTQPASDSRSDTGRCAGARRRADPAGGNTGGGEVTPADVLHMIVNIGWRILLLMIIVLAVTGGDRPAT